MARTKIINKNANEFFQAIQGKAVVTPTGLRIRRSDLKELEEQFGLNKEKRRETRPRTFDQARVMAMKDNEEWVDIPAPGVDPRVTNFPHVAAGA